MVRGFSHRIRLLTNLGILFWVSILQSVSRAMRNGLVRLLLRIAPDTTSIGGILVSTYEQMREHLKDSLKEIEGKTQQLEESWGELKQSRDLLQTTIDSIGADLIVIDRNMIITQANRSFRERYTDRNVIGRYCYEVSHKQNHPCQPPNCVCPASKVWKSGKLMRVVHVHTFDNEGSNQPRYFEIVASPLYNKNHRVSQIVELVQDITKSKEQENRIRETNRVLRVLNTIMATANESLDLDRIFNNALERVMEITQMEIGDVLFLDERTKTYSSRISYGLPTPQKRKSANITLSQEIADIITAEGSALVIDDITKDPRVSHGFITLEEGIRSFLGVPLKSRERIIGVLTIASRTSHSFSPQEVQLLTALGHQLGITIENVRLYQELQAREQSRAELLRKLIKVQEDERRRVARELHDVTSQALATLAVRVETLGSVTKSDTNESAILLEEIKNLLTHTSKEVHSLIYDLRPSLLDDLGLPSAVRSCAHNVLEAVAIEVHLEVSGQEKRLPPEIEIAVFRITQEAITNIVSHSRAESVYISFEFKDRCIAVQVEDDGIGFNLLEVLSSAHAKESMGLLGMKERAALLGGTLNIDTESGKGTRINVEIPLNPERGDIYDKRTIGG